MRRGVIAFVALVACGTPPRETRTKPGPPPRPRVEGLPIVELEIPRSRGLVLQVRIAAGRLGDLAPPGTARLSTSKDVRIALARAADRSDAHLAALDQNLATLTEDGFRMRALLRLMAAEPDRDASLAAAEAFLAHVPASSPVRPIAEYIHLFAQNELSGDSETANAMLDLAIANPGSIIEERAYELGALGLELSRDVPTIARAIEANRWLVEHGSSTSERTSAQRRLAAALALERDPTALAELCRLDDAPAPVARLLIDDRTTGTIRDACVTNKCPCTEAIVRATARLADDEDREDIAIDLYTLLRVSFPHARDRVVNQCNLVRILVRANMHARAAEEWLAMPNDAECKTTSTWIPKGTPIERASAEIPRAALAACAVDTQTPSALVTVEWTVGRDDRAIDLAVDGKFAPAFGACVGDAVARHRWLDLRHRRFRVDVVVGNGRPVPNF